ncbi:MAG: tRNA dihydrouridine synthase DusB [Gemmataceae bacterium]
MHTLAAPTMTSIDQPNWPRPPAGLAEPLRLGSLELPTRFLMAPLAGYTNLPFRLAVRELGGVGLATTDLVNARALVRASRKTLELIDTCPADRPMAVQIYGADPVEMADAAQWLENYGVSSVDINMGCPVHKVTRGGGGSALMCSPTNTVRLVEKVAAAVRIPVTVKMRLGWDDSSWSAPYFARAFEQVGVAAVTIHGRTRDQGFGGDVRLAGIAAVVAAVKRLPIIGNGDVRAIHDAARMFDATGCAAIAIGRGALLNPWLFAQLRHWQDTGAPSPPASYDQRLTFMARHFHLLVAQRGERFACLTFRKVANWYCKVLKPGRELQQRLIRLAAVADFDNMVQQLRDRGPASAYDESRDVSFVRVPSGPVERW